MARGLLVSFLSKRITVPLGVPYLMAFSWPNRTVCLFEANKRWTNERKKRDPNEFLAALHELLVAEEAILLVHELLLRLLLFLGRVHQDEILHPELSCKGLVRGDLREEDLETPCKRADLGIFRPTTNAFRLENKQVSERRFRLTTLGYNKAPRGVAGPHRLSATSLHP